MTKEIAGWNQGTTAEMKIKELPQPTEPPQILISEGAQETFRNGGGKVGICSESRESAKITLPSFTK